MYFTFIIAVLNFLQVGTESEMEARIVKGRGIKIRKHPYSVFILIYEDTAGYMCGGSIINQKIVLTAAHCFETVTEHSIITATVGSSHFQKGRKILVDHLKIHPDYDTETIVNDIALAGLKESLVFGQKIKRIIMATRRPKTGKATIAGWGLVQEVPYAMYTSNLHELTQRIIPPAKCKKIIKDLQNGTFCGGKLHARSYPSVGDSGSPLVYKGYIQIGLVSYKNTILSRSVIVYTDIAYFYTWIVHNAKSVYCNAFENSQNIHIKKDMKDFAKWWNTE